MSNDSEYPAGCSDEFAELCALSTSGELSLVDAARLREHVRTCSACADLLREYSSLAHVGMVKLATEFGEEGKMPQPHRERKAEHRFVAALHSGRYSAQHSGQYSARSLPPEATARVHWPDLVGWLEQNRSLIPVYALGTAAVLIACVVGAFQLGRRIEAHSRDASYDNMSVARLRLSSSAAPSPSPSSSPSASASSSQSSSATQAPNAGKIDLQQQLPLQKQLLAAQKAVDEVTKRSAEAEKRIAELSSARISLLARIEELTKKDESSAEALVAATQTVTRERDALTQQHDSLQQQLNDASKTLEQVKQNLVRAQQDRQGALLRVTDLETEIGELHAEASKANSAAANNEQFLAQDRDIRELMGARQLYIADVFDIQDDGRRSKPFGRVFYTKGKSLIFYAFDLQAQPGYREAKAFQAWGKPDSASAKPVSLGIFYLDNEQNRRWVLKSDNPDLLAQINAVFVTVEPHGGSQKPTGKPFLEAYLHSLAPNHP